MSRTTPRTLSGITPSGRLTLGNHLGALRRFASTPGHYFVADLHALTTAHDPALLRERTRETALLLLASGIDPEQSCVFVQSHVREHAELSYLLECTTYVGELARMIQFKEKGGRPRTRASLFTYPCLMAADMLAYDTECVPVGGDQDQHVELARDVAARFNRTYGTTFTVPSTARVEVAARVADLADPTVKMSKSAPDDAMGVVRLLDDEATVRRKVARAVTDSVGRVTYDPAGQPGVANLLEVLAACTGRGVDELVAEHGRYGALKGAVADAVVAELAPLQRRYRELQADPARVDALLAAGAARAAERAGATLARARAAIGLG
jgi:tryptophanyl-tRNA synthetase